MEFLFQVVIAKSLLVSTLITLSSSPAADVIYVFRVITSCQFNLIEAQLKRQEDFGFCIF